MDSKLGLLAVVVALYVCAVSALPPCTCTRNLAPVCGSDGVTYSNECVFYCEKSKQGSDITIVRPGTCEPPCTCPDYINEVCGSDGSNYPNPCVLNCATARDHTLRIKHPGRCDENVNVDDFSCFCTEELREVCGTDGKTYSNACKLNCATAKDNTLGIKHSGKCDDSNNVAAEPLCICTFELKEVCGTDGKTYPNACSLNCATAKDHTLGIKHTGRCAESVNVAEPPCICTEELREVCGTDGKTYPNACNLNCATAKDHTLGIKYSGKCAESVNVAEPPCICTDDLREVCGTDGNTYPNACNLNCATAKDHTLGIKHQGECASSVKVEDFPCFCTQEFKEVCGTDGTTYPNACRLNCATAKDHTLGIKHQGKCGNEVEDFPCTCTDDLNEVCGSDGNTYPNSCRLNCATAKDHTLGIKYQGKCAEAVQVVNPDFTPVNPCGSGYPKPVCGTNGQTYLNECLLRNDGATLAHNGPCSSSAVPY